MLSLYRKSIKYNSISGHTDYILGFNQTLKLPKTAIILILNLLFYDSNLIVLRELEDPFVNLIA